MTDLTSFFNNTLDDTDPEVAAAISDEMIRQQDQIEMIASENIVSNAVLEAQGSVLTNKYAEGYSGRRYYGGCEHIDVVETQSHSSVPPVWYSVTRVSKKFFSLARSIVSLIHGNGFLL